MPRPERPIDPNGGAVQEFAAALRSLRERAGRPGYRQLANRAHFSATTLSDAAGGKRLPSLAVTLAYVAACGGDATAWQERWRAVAAEVGVDVRSGTGNGGGDPAGEPYRGLAAYQTCDAAWFFGRERLAAELSQRLCDRRLLAVFGPSGCGKSSLLRAGLIPAATRDRIAVVFTPGARPLTELAARLGRLAGLSAGSLVAELTGDPQRIRPVARQALVAVTPGAEHPGAEHPANETPGAELLVVVDQFEEIFTLCTDPAERAAFVAVLVAAARAAEVRVVLGVRADYYARCAEHPDLVAALRDSQVLVGPMTATELREAIVRPAERAGLMVEGALVTTIVADVAGRPGALPLASHALLEAWRRRRGKAVTLAGYLAAGGVDGAVAQTAERVYADLGAEQRRAAREALSRMIEIGEDGEPRRRRVDRDELGADDATGVVLDRLATARLVTLGAGTAEIAHEALARAWPRLREWLDEDRDAVRIRRQLAGAAAEWEALGRESGALYRGIRLVTAAQWAAGRDGRLARREQQFLAASLAAQRREQTVRRRRFGLVLAGLTTAVVTVSALAGVALAQSGRARDERDLARSGQLVGYARAQLALDPELGLLLARRAYQIRPTEQAEAALRQATVESRVHTILTGHIQPVRDVAFSPDGRWLASTGDSAVRLVDPSRPDQPVVLAGEVRMQGLTFSPDGRLLVAAGVAGRVTVFDLVERDRRMDVLGHRADVATVAFSPDGDHLASGSEDGEVRLWTRFRPPLSTLVGRHGGPVRAVAFSPDSTRLASAGDDGVRLWRPGHPGASVPAGGRGAVLDVAFSPDGRLLAGAGADGAVLLWDLRAGSPPVPLRGHEGPVRGLAFDPTGRRLASTGDDGTVRIWTVGRGTASLRTLRGHGAPVHAAAFSPDGRLLATGGDDERVRVWDTGGRLDPVRFGGTAPARDVAFSADGTRLAGSHGGGVSVWPVDAPGPPVSLPGADAGLLGFSADGRRLVGAGAGGRVRVWDTNGRRDPLVLDTPHGTVVGVAINPVGTVVAAGGDRGTVLLSTVDDRAQPVILPGPTEAPSRPDYVSAVAFTPDGRLLASGGSDGTVRLWELGSRPVQRVVGTHDGPVSDVVFSPDGSRIASAGGDGTVRIWRTDGTGAPVVLPGHPGGVTTVSYAPDGQRLASAGRDGAVRVWKTNGSREPVVFNEYGAIVTSVAFSPDGRRLATAHRDGTVQVWRCEVCGPVEEVLALAGQRATRELTPAEREIFLAGQRG